MLSNIQSEQEQIQKIMDDTKCSLNEASDEYYSFISSLKTKLNKEKIELDICQKKNDELKKSTKKDIINGLNVGSKVISELVKMKTENMLKSADEV